MKKLLYILLFVPIAFFGQENYSLSFDGDDDYVIIENNGSDLFQNHTQLSISANVKFNSNSVWGVIAEHHESYWEGTINPNQTVGWYLRRNAESENIHFNFYTAQGSVTSIESSVIIPLDEWVNVTGVFNGEDSKIYVNGEDVSYNQSIGEYIGNEIITPNDNIMIGNASWEPSMQGKLSNLHIWGKALSAQEINQYITCPPAGNESDLYGYWNFNEGSGNILNDISGNGNNGLISEAIYSEDVLEETCSSIIDQLNQSFDAWNISINLSAGWNMFGYGCPTSIDLAQGLSNHTELIAMVKDNNGSAYIPEFDFNGIGDLTPGFGYQIKVTEVIEGFSLCDWYVDDIPEDNIVSLQEENLAFRDSLIYLLNNNCIHEGYCGYNEDNNACYYPNQGYDCDGNFIPQIGHEVMGGILFYYDEDLNRGLIVAQEDIDTFAPWGCFGFNVDGLNSSIGSGLNNSILITQQCDETPNAAQLCLEYEYSGYSDWYLTSYEELLLMWSSVGQGAQYIGNVSNFNDGGYWSSSQQNITDAKFLFFDHFDAPYYITNYSKGVTLRVRPIRSFGNWTMGCMDSIACNFNPDANMTDGSCEYPELGYDCDGSITEYLVGMEAQGGIVFYVDETGEHGLVASIEDLGQYEWGCYGTGLSGASGISIGSGYQNTLDIVSGCSETPIAASEALGYESKGYSDWYLPSKDELYEMYSTIGQGGLEGNIGGFGDIWYLSSSERDSHSAWFVFFDNGNVHGYGKNGGSWVRVIRSF
ncbi:hypothetical protein N9Y35_01550 [Flavobacteriales bacterium]|nr:hypothetical protein [Flavobacteriales bacterium]